MKLLLALLILIAPLEASFIDSMSPFLKEACCKAASEAKDIDDILKRFTEEGILELEGPDREIRPVFVAIQAMMEEALSLELHLSITSLMGVIHTPMPATPLCTEGSLSPGLVHQSVEEDPFALIMTLSRASTVRNFLYRGGDLYCAYPKEGLHQRTELQKAIYSKALNIYAGHLFDRPLDLDHLPPELTGAFYLFTDTEGNKGVFAIQITQANNPLDNGRYTIWFGSLNTPPILERIRLIKESVLVHSAEPITLDIE